jgi:hypothetical protein
MPIYLYRCPYGHSALMMENVPDRAQALFFQQAAEKLDLRASTGPHERKTPVYPMTTSFLLRLSKDERRVSRSLLV